MNIKKQKSINKNAVAKRSHDEYKGFEDKIYILDNGIDELALGA